MSTFQFEADEEFQIILNTEIIPYAEYASKKGLSDDRIIELAKLAFENSSDLKPVENVFRLLADKELGK